MSFIFVFQARLTLDARQEHDPELDGELIKHQAIMELTMDAWKEAIRLFDIREPTIPHRNYTNSQPLSRTGWYS